MKKVEEDLVKVEAKMPKVEEHLAKVEAISRRINNGKSKRLHRCNSLAFVLRGS